MKNVFSWLSDIHFKEHFAVGSWALFISFAARILGDSETYQLGLKILALSPFIAASVFIIVFAFLKAKKLGE